jgi:hypothetical protein
VDAARLGGLLQQLGEQVEQGQVCGGPLGRVLGQQVQCEVAEQGALGAGSGSDCSNSGSTAIRSRGSGSPAPDVASRISTADVERASSNRASNSSCLPSKCW